MPHRHVSGGNSLQPEGVERDTTFWKLGDLGERRSRREPQAAWTRVDPNLDALRMLRYLPYIVCRADQREDPDRPC